MVKESEKMDQPGKELPKEFREVATELVANQGWRYSRQHGRHPVLYPADRTMAPVTVPTTPGDHRALRNWLSEVRRRGGIWPPAQGRK
jgi:predicted RNA binding protein YcfA (HicA-like mRNA interferase family)